MFLSLCIFCPWAFMKMLENTGFEKQLVTNSLSAFSLSLAVLSTPWKTCIHYLFLAPKNNSCMLVQLPYAMLPQHIGRNHAV